MGDDPSGEYGGLAEGSLLSRYGANSTGNGNGASSRGVSGGFFPWRQV